MQERVCAACLPAQGVHRNGAGMRVAIGDGGDVAVCRVAEAHRVGKPVRFARQRPVGVVRECFGREDDAKAVLALHLRQVVVAIEGRDHLISQGVRVRQREVVRVVGSCGDDIRVGVRAREQIAPCIEARMPDVGAPVRRLRFVIAAVVAEEERPLPPYSLHFFARRYFSNSRRRIVIRFTCSSFLL